MERVGIYLMASANILLGFYIYYRGNGRFGLLNYRSFLDKEEKEAKKRS